MNQYPYEIKITNTDFEIGGIPCQLEFMIAKGLCSVKEPFTIDPDNHKIVGCNPVGHDFVEFTVKPKTNKKHLRLVTQVEPTKDGCHLVTEMMKGHFQMKIYLPIIHGDGDTSVEVGVDEPPGEPPDQKQKPKGK